MTTEEENNGMSAEEQAAADGDSGSASRARNRTVMLTPEITGEVRARLAQDMAASSGGAIPGLRKAGDAEESASQGTSVPGMTRPAAVPAAPPVQEAAPVASPAPVQQRVAAAAGTGVIYTKPSPIAGFLVSYDEDEHGEVFELRTGRLIVTSEPPGAGNYMVINDETVSSMHAIVRVAGFGEIQILDQLSEFGTKIIRAEGGVEEELSGDKSVLHHGDVVVFGERRFSFCLVHREEE